MGLFQRVLILWIIVLLICSVAVIIGRVLPTTDTLHPLGFATCMDDPCFKGIRAGANWTVAMLQFRGKMVGPSDDQHLELFDGSQSIEIFPSQDHTSVERIEIKSDRLLPFTAATVITDFGAPCYGVLLPDADYPQAVNLIYPHLTVSISVLIYEPGSPYPSGSRFQPNSPVAEFNITTVDAANSFDDGFCHDPTHPNAGLWHGFMSLENYRIRYAHDSEQR